VKKITVEIDPELYEKLKEVRSKRGIVIRHIINEGIQEQLKKLGLL